MFPQPVIIQNTVTQISEGGEERIDLQAVDCWSSLLFTVYVYRLQFISYLFSVYRI